MTASSPQRFRTLFISDVHLGMKGCQAERLLDFLRCYDAETIYLVGDIVDGWALKSSWYWPQTHNDVAQKLLRKARHGARVVYIPGNRDEFLRDYCGTHFGGIEVVEHAIHEAADGKRYLVVHGDLFDVVIRHARWLALTGDAAYDMAIALNTVFNRVRRGWIGLLRASRRALRALLSMRRFGVCHAPTSLILRSIAKRCVSKDAQRLLQASP